jgi:uncharacterized protein (TIGR03437 family)
VTPGGTIATFAGGGSGPSGGDGGPATKAVIVGGATLVLDASGNLLIADRNRVRRVDPSGIISTVAGNGNYGSTPDGAAATSGGLNTDFVAVDRSGNLILQDSVLVRKVSPDGIITTAAGSPLPPPPPPGEPFPPLTQLLPSGVAADSAGNIYVSDAYSNSVQILRPTDRTVFINAIVDAATQRAGPVAPGKIVVIYGTGLAGDGETRVSFNGIEAEVLYAYAAQVAAIVPAQVSGAAVQVLVTRGDEQSERVSVELAASAPGMFTLNQTGGGQAVALNADLALNTAENPEKAGETVTLFATGEGVAALPVSVTLGGVPAPVESVRRTDPGVARIVVRVPYGVRPGGYVPVVLKVGDVSTTPGAVWIAIRP